MRALDSEYQKLLDLALAGKGELVTKTLRDLRLQREALNGRRDDNSRRTLASRLSLKAGFNDVEVPNGETRESQDPELQAEALTVKGLKHFQNGEMAAGAQSFRAAARVFASLGNARRELISLFNAEVGELPEAGRYNLQEALEKFRAIERRALEIDDKKTLGLAYRQKSYLYFENRLPAAALSEIEMSLSILELWGAPSDWHLGLLHAAHCAINAGDRLRARAHFEKVPSHVESRVEFPRALIESLVEGRELPNPDAFRTVNPHWRERLLNLQQEQRGPGEVADARPDLKPNSLEAKLYDLLLEGKRSKERLCEELWPTTTEQVQHLDNRLHRLISRFNKKHGRRLLFDGSYYRLRR